METVEWFTRASFYLTVVLMTTAIVLAVLGVGLSNFCRYLERRWYNYRWWRAFERDCAEKGLCTFRKPVPGDPSLFYICTRSSNHYGQHANANGPIPAGSRTLWRQNDSNVS